MLPEWEPWECRREEGVGESVRRERGRRLKKERRGREEPAEGERESWRGSPCNAPPPAEK